MRNKKETCNFPVGFIREPSLPWKNTKGKKISYFSESSAVTNDKRRRGQNGLGRWRESKRVFLWQNGKRRAENALLLILDDKARKKKLVRFMMMMIGNSVQEIFTRRLPLCICLILFFPRKKNTACVFVTRARKRK